MREKWKAAPVPKKDQEIINICNFLIQELTSITESAVANNLIDKRKMRILVTPPLRQMFARFSGYPINYPMRINDVELKTIEGNTPAWYVSIAGERLHMKEVKNEN